MKNGTPIFLDGLIRALIMLVAVITLSACTPAAVVTPETTFLEPSSTPGPTFTPKAEPTDTQTPELNPLSIQINYDANGNILPNPVGEWTKLPQDENQRILIGPEGSNIVLELDARLGMSEFIFNNGEDDYFTKDGKTPQDRIYEVVNNSLYYYWCSTQGGGCAPEPADMKGVDIDFWSYKNKEGRGNIRIENGVTFKVMPLWDKSGGPGNWDKLTDGEKAYKNVSGSELFYETSPEGELIITYAIDDLDKYKEWPFLFNTPVEISQLFLSAGWNLHDETPISIDSILVEESVKNYPGVGNWISLKEDFQPSTIQEYFTDIDTLLENAEDPNLNAFMFLIK